MRYGNHDTGCVISGADAALQYFGIAQHQACHWTRDVDHRQESPRPLIKLHSIKLHSTAVWSGNGHEFCRGLSSCAGRICVTGCLSMLERAQCAQQLVMHCLTAGEPQHRPEGCHASGQELTQPPSGGRFGISARPPVHPWEAPGVLRAQHEVLHALHRREAPVQRLQRLPAAGLAVREEILLGMQGHVSRDHLSAAASPHRLQTTHVQVHGAGRLQHPVRARWNTLEAQPLAVRCSPMCMASAGLCHKPEGISCSQRLCALFCSHLR